MTTDREIQLVYEPQWQTPVTEDIRPVLLTVLAHPDDESFGTGGTLAWYASCGVEVHVICATGGEVGGVDPELLQGYASVAERRLAELRCAAHHLGVTGVHLLGYRDSACPAHPIMNIPRHWLQPPLDEVSGRITRAIRQIRPQVVITFDPIGGYRHPDHIAVHQATVEAFHAAGDPQRYPSPEPAYQPQKLYFQTFPRGLLRFMIRLLPLFGKDPRRFGRNADVDLTSFANEEFPINAQIDFIEVWRQRDAAIMCHSSQIGAPSFTRTLLQEALRWFGAGETFMRAHPPAAPRLRERDLFADVVWRL
ncbi:MAG: GlcNAc-PI de-N-acetylase [Chloroflexaceae bacterium]|nr:GlcNAc-PI de-N-acetylase [Chloroflexaceae bacterium]